MHICIMNSMYWMKNDKMIRIITGIMASAHSPCPLCNSLIFSASLQICTRSPTVNGVGGGVILALSVLAEEAVLGLFTLVNTAGLNVHLKK